MENEKDDMIDFRKLEAELATAIAKDEKHSRENDAKFRAIRQKVASYDEFRDIVLASHLKPLDKKDISGGMPYQAWNQMASNSVSTESANLHLKENSKVGMTMPKTSAEFSKLWKHSCKSLKDKFNFLCQMDAETLKIIFVTDAPLGEIAACIKKEASYPNDLETVIQILEVISKSKRLSLMVDFLDDQEKQDLNDIFVSCESAIVSDDKTEIKQSFQVLRSKYKIVT